MAMEHFDDMQTNRTKEKSVYLLHLDTPRIIIIACALVGILIIAFLIGMNFSTEERSERHVATGNEAIFAPLPDEPARDTGEIHAAERPNEPETADKASQDHAQNAVAADSKAPSPAISTPAKDSAEKAVAQKSGKESSDLLTQDTANDIIPAKTQPQEKKSKSTHVISRSKKNSEGERVQPKSKQHRTVEVASKTVRNDTAQREGFAVQVAAYSSRAKALQEVNKLKEHRYDPYIENTRLNGKNFFRVKIGPISSRKEAVKVLDEIKEMNRYEHSYITQE
jgi:DedD protein